jgi:putative ABC transport system permease protein
MWTGHLKTAIGGLRLSKWRTTFTMLGIIIGISSVVTVVSLGEGVKQQIVGQINQLGSNVLTVRPGKLVNRQGNLGNLNLYAFLAPSTLTIKDVVFVSHLNSVSNVAPIEFITNVASGDKGELDDLFVAGTSSNLPSILHLNIIYGGPIAEEDQDQNFAIIGSDVALKMFGELNPVGSTIHINGQDFIVHGVLAPTNGGLLSVSQADYNSSVFITTTAAEALGGGHANILQMLIQTKDAKNIDASASQVQAAIAKNHGGTVDFSVLKQKELLGASNQALKTVTTFITGVAAISLLVGGIGIMNIMLVSVTERTREIGIRKAVGATNRQILNQFLVEGLVLSIGGGIIGIGVSYFINLFLRIYTNWKPVISLDILFLAVCISVLAGVLFSIAPAFQAARKDPITALRGE